MCPQPRSGGASCSALCADPRRLSKSASRGTCVVRANPDRGDLVGRAPLVALEVLLEVDAGGFLLRTPRGSAAMSTSASGGTCLVRANPDRGDLVGRAPLVALEVLLEVDAVTAPPSVAKKSPVKKPV